MIIRRKEGNTEMVNDKRASGRMEVRMVYGEREKGGGGEGKNGQ